MDSRPEEGIARGGLTLARAREALKDWQGHMRRGAALPSEDEYVAALALVPWLPQPGVYLARTLRAFADFCSAQGRLDDAVSLLARIAEGPGRKSEVFWRDYAVLLFRQALKRLAAGRVAQSNESLGRAAALLRGPAALPEVWNAAWEGYSEMALWFERAGDALPARLHAEHALEYAQRCGRREEALEWLRRLAQAAQHGRGAFAALDWLRRMHALGREGWTGAGAFAVRSAVGLAQAEAALGREAGMDAIFHEVETWLREPPSDLLALADLNLAWGLVLGLERGRERLEQAHRLRSTALGEDHPKTLEAFRALGGWRQEDTGPSPGTDSGPREWDGGARFEGPKDSGGESQESELKRLHRRLARLCHPDAGLDDASESEITWRHETMIRVNQAAESGNLFLLRALLDEALSRMGTGKQVPL